MSRAPADLVVDLESINPGLLEELAELYPGQSHKQALWSWQFSHRFGRNCLAVTARDSGRLVGFNGLMPVCLTRGDRDQSAWWSCDFIVDPAHQGCGVGSRMKDHLLKQISEPILSLGISPQAWPILLEKGWRPGPQLPLYERIFKPRRHRQWLFKLWGDSLVAFTELIWHRDRACGWRFESHQHLPGRDQVDQLWKRWRPRRAVAVVRDYAYLQWRYQFFPFRLYHYLLIFNAKSELQGLVVYRFDGESRVEVTDYLGPEPDVQLIRRISQRLRGEGAEAILWCTQAPELQHLLGLSGYIRKRYATRFVYRPLGQDQGPINWRLSSGDSDGDFLSAARDCIGPTLSNATASDAYSLRDIDSESLSLCREQWEALIKQSRANPLFMSWQWQHTWWLVWGQKLNLELRCFFIYHGECLVGILPLFRARPGRFRLREYHFLGNAWRLAPSVRSEYIEPIFARNQEQALYAFFEGWTRRLPAWSCLIVPDHVGPMSDWCHALVRGSDRGYKVSTQGDLNDYLAQLGRNTRLRAFNRLDYLNEEYPNARWGEFGSSRGDLSRFFEIMNAFHQKRWGKPCFLPEAVEFHCRLIAQPSRFKPLLHYLEVNGRIRSVSYNMWVDGVLYNLQSGFELGFDPKLSLGTLHFGKLIRLCFEDPDTQALDLLAGIGKRTDYKANFKGKRIRFNSVQLFPNSWLYWGYRFITRSKAKFRSG